MTRRFLLVLVLFVALVPSSLFAATFEELQAQVKALREQLAAVERQLAAAVPVLSGSSASCFEGRRNLARGMSGEDVIRLQNFLKQTGYLSAEATGFFGPLTEAAVQKWQARNRIVIAGRPEINGYGLVGPKTRAAMSCRAAARERSAAEATPRGKRFCILGQVAMAHGTSLKFYSRESVEPGESCAGLMQTRSCSDGVLSGDAAYIHLTCAEGSPLNCVVGGTTVLNGMSATFYSYESVLEGDSCANYETQRMCTEGTLSGSAAHVHSICTVKQEASGSLFDLFSTTQTGTTGVGFAGFFSPTSSVPKQRSACMYQGTSYPHGMRTEGRDINSLCLGLSFCGVGTNLLSQFECRDGTWQPVAGGGQTFSPTTFEGDCTPVDAGCHFCIAGNYGYWTTAPICK